MSREVENIADGGAAINPKRVLLAVRWPVGGIRTFIKYVYGHFDCRRYSFTILGPDIPEMDLFSEDLPGLDVRIIKLPPRPSTREFSLAIFKAVRSGTYDLVHSHGFTSGICASLPAFIFRLPHIMSSHDVLNQKQFEGLGGSLKKQVMRAALSMLHVIHSVSSDAQENLFEYFPALSRTRKCFVIPNGIVPEVFTTALPRDLRSELGVGNDVFLIGFLGRFMAQKGFLYLVEAIKTMVADESLPQKPLVVCFGDDGYVREERRKINAEGLTDHFAFLPFTADVAGVLKSLDVVVMPSLWEACPLLPMEVMVAGTPLIASDCIGLREVIRDTIARQIPARDVCALATALANEMQNPSKELARRASKQYAEIFDVRDQARQLERLYENCLGI